MKKRNKIHLLTIMILFTVSFFCFKTNTLASSNDLVGTGQLNLTGIKDTKAWEDLNTALNRRQSNQNSVSNTENNSKFSTVSESNVPTISQTYAYTNYVTLKITGNADKYLYTLSNGTSGTVYTSYDGNFYLYNLKAGTTYTIKVYPSDNINLAKTIPIVTAPDYSSVSSKSIKMTKATKSTATITWEKVDGATSYLLYYVTSANEDKYYTVYSTQNSTTLKNLPAGCIVGMYIYPLRTATSGSYTFTSKPRSEYCYSAYTYGGYSDNPIQTVGSKITKFTLSQFITSTNSLRITCTTNQYYDGVEYVCYTGSGKKLCSGKKDALLNSFYLSLYGYKFQQWNYVKVRTYTKLSSGTKVYSAWSDKFYFSKKKNAGTSFTKNSIIYKINKTSSNGKTGTMRCVGVSTSKKSATIPATIKLGGTKFKVVSIAAKAFQNKTKLKSVTIGSNVKTIGASAFSGCSKLKVLTIKSTVLKKVGAKALSGIYKKAKIKVPKSKLAKYKKLFKSKGQSSSVKIIKK